MNTSSLRFSPSDCVRNLRLCFVPSSVTRSLFLSEILPCCHHLEQGKMNRSCLQTSLMLSTRWERNGKRIEVCLLSFFSALICLPVLCFWSACVSPLLFSQIPLFVLWSLSSVSLFFFALIFLSFFPLPFLFSFVLVSCSYHFSRPPKTASWSPSHWQRSAHSVRKTRKLSSHFSRFLPVVISLLILHHGVSFSLGSPTLSFHAIHVMASSLFFSFLSFLSLHFLFFMLYFFSFVDLSSLLEGWVQRINEDQGLNVRSVSAFVSLLNARVIDDAVSLHEKIMKEVLLPASPLTLHKQHESLVGRLFQFSLAFLTVLCFFLTSLLSSFFLLFRFCFFLPTLLLSLFFCISMLISSFKIWKMGMRLFVLLSLLHPASGFDVISSFRAEDAAITYFSSNLFSGSDENERSQSSQQLKVSLMNDRQDIRKKRGIQCLNEWGKKERKKVLPFPPPHHHNSCPVILPLVLFFVSPLSP